MDNPYLDLAPNALAQACDARAGELQARAWHSEEERNALREATANSSPPSRASCAAPRARRSGRSRPRSGDLREIIATRVSHAPLHPPAAHAWVNDFAPGGGALPGVRD